MSEPDYLPLTPGTRLEYSVERSGESGRLLVEHLSAEGGVRVRRTWTGADGRAQVETSLAQRRADGVYFDGALALPAPARPGASWSSPPRRFRVESLDASAEVPAGRFADCLRVVYLIAEGDAGSGEKLFAPGVGLVRELCADEADPYEVSLVARGTA